MCVRRGFFSAILILTTITLFTVFIYMGRVNTAPTPSSVNLINKIYGYKLGLFHVGIAPRYVTVIDEFRVVIAGSIGDIQGVVVLDISNPYRDPVVEDIYPLTGEPTSIGVSGHPVDRIVIGTSKGEVLLFKVDRGRITSHLYAVLGADFYVDKVYVARTPSGEYKIIVLAVEGGTRSYPCLNCYVYVLDEEATGILRIGPRVGNATETCRGLENIQIQDIVPLTIYSIHGYYWSAERVLVAYIPQITTLSFQVNYVDVETGNTTPLPHVLVEVNLTYVNSGNYVIYGVNADENGNVRIPIPRVETEILLVNLSIRDNMGNTIWRYSYVFNPNLYREIPDEIPLPPAALTTRDVDTRPAALIYGTPLFLRTRLELLDFSNAPYTCTKKYSTDLTLEPTEIDIKFTRGENSDVYKVTYIDPTRGALYIASLNITNTDVSRISLIRDYVGIGTRLIATGDYWNGVYLVTGLSDGRIRVYSYENGSHRLRNIYVLGSPLVNLITIPYIEGYVYVGVSTRGLQVLKIEPYPLPVFRGLTSLYLTTSRFIHGDVLANLSTIVLIEEQNIFIVKNTDIVVKKKTPMVLDKFIARDISLHLSTPRGEEVNETIIKLSYPGGVVKYTVRESSFILRNIIPGVIYHLEISPLRQDLYQGSITFTLREDLLLEVSNTSRLEVSNLTNCCLLRVNLTYREFDIVIYMTDEITGDELQAPLDVYVNNKPYAKSIRENRIRLRLIPGEYSISITPSTGYEYVYIPEYILISVERDGEINVSLRRVRYVVYFTVYDVFRQLISPVDLRVIGVVNASFTVTSPDQLIEALLPSGEYSVRVIPRDPRVYGSHELKLNVDSPRSIPIILQRVTYRLEIMLYDRYGIMGSFELYANDTKILDELAPTSLVELPYGIYEIKLNPRPEFTRYYEPVGPVIVNLFNDTSITIPLTRKTYRVKAIVTEQGNPVSNAVVNIYTAEGELVTLLITDSAGIVETNILSGVYRIVVSHDQYVTEDRYIVVDRDIVELFSLRPTLLVVLSRSMPIILLLIGTGIGIYVALKIRAKIASRLTEEVF